MKSKILLLIATFLTTFSFAQQNPSFGIRAGLSSASMRGDAVNSMKDLLDFTNGKVTSGSRTGFFAGGYATIPVSEIVSIEPALYYSQKGHEMKGELGLKGMEFLGVNAKAYLNARYIDVPVLVKASFNGFQVFAGPQVSYLTQANLHTTAGAFGINFLNRKMDATDQYNRWDAAVTGGIGYQFANGLNVMAAYDHGLLKADANRNTDAYNQSVKVGIGITF